MSSRRRAFSLVELLVVLAILTLVLALLLPALAAARERGNRIRCAANLRAIHQGIATYVTDHRKFPRARAHPNNVSPHDHWPFHFTNPDAADPFLPTGPRDDDLTAAYFHLIRVKLLTPAVFVCPSTFHHADALGGQPASARSNFQSSDTLSYGFINPYPITSHPIDNLFVPRNHTRFDYAIAADRNEVVNRFAAFTPNAPRESIRQMNSLNHRSAGQNVVYLGGHVVWTETPYAGANGDHIYINTFDGRHGLYPPLISPMPIVLDDTIILPVYPLRGPGHTYYLVGP